MTNNAIDLKPAVIDAIIDSMPVGVLVVGPRGEMLMTNATAEDLLGYSQEQLLSGGWADLFITETGNVEFNQVFLDVIRQELVHLKRSVPYERPDGKVLWLVVNSSYLKHGEETLGVVVLITDVSDRHRFYTREKELMLHNSRIQEERGEGLKHLALSVSHQIRNPVMNIGGFSNLLLRKSDLSEECRERLTTILSEAQRLESIVKAVADYASLPPVKPQTVHALGLMEAACADLLARADKLGKKVKLSEDAPKAEVVADPVLLKRALDELLKNAMEFSPQEEVAVEAVLSKHQDGFSIVVTNKGATIAEDDLPFVFDPFFTTKSQGVGMGLAVALRIAKEHRGELTVENMAGGGVVARLDIPQGEKGCQITPGKPGPKK